MQEVLVLKDIRVQVLLVLAAGAVLGYAAASGKFRLHQAAGAPDSQPVAQAEQTTGVPGSPSATTTISGKQLPPPDPKFGGVIKENAAQSKAWWAPRVVPPKQ